MKTHKIPNTIFYKHLKETKSIAHKLPSRLLTPSETCHWKSTLWTI